MNDQHIIFIACVVLFYATLISFMVYVRRKRRAWIDKMTPEELEAELRRRLP